jgi:hypothetical protein
MMTHGCMLWGAALYNNGAVPEKPSRYGESYSMNGTPQRLQTVPPPSEEEQRLHGVVPFLDPLPRYEISQPGNVLRIFERGGRFRSEVGIPETLEESGRPRTRLSDRFLDQIKWGFGDILVGGTFEQVEALPEEANEPELAQLPRLTFRFDRHAVGRLRQLIDVINAEG